MARSVSPAAMAAFACSQVGVVIETTSASESSGTGRLLLARLVDGGVADVHGRLPLVDDEEHVERDELVSLALETVDDPGARRYVVAIVDVAEVLHRALDVDPRPQPDVLRQRVVGEAQQP